MEKVHRIGNTTITTTMTNVGEMRINPALASAAVACHASAGQRSCLRLGSGATSGAPPAANWLIPGTS